MATTNGLPQDEQGEDKVYEGNFERLHMQARQELDVFMDYGMADLIEEGRASHGVLVSRLDDMFIKHLETTWVPTTLKKLSEEKKKKDFENAALGMPPAHEEEAPKQVRDALVKAVEEALDLRVPPLLKEYAVSVLNPLKHAIKDVVAKAIKDAFPFPGVEIKSSRSVYTVDVPLERFDQVCERAPDVCTPLMELVNSPQYSFDAQVECLRNSFLSTNWKQPEWPSKKADQVLKNPPLLLVERFSSVIDDIIDVIKCDLKPKADALILQDVTGCVQRFSDEVARVENWCTTLNKKGDGMSVEVVTGERMQKFAEDLVRHFLRYNAALLREVRARVRQVVEQASLIESCAEQRRAIISRQQAVERAREGVFELIGVRTQEEQAEYWDSIQVIYLKYVCVCVCVCVCVM